MKKRAKKIANSNPVAKYMRINRYKVQPAKAPYSRKRYDVRREAT